MATTGWQIITTPIAGLNMILADTNNSTIGQIIQHDGTKFVNTSVAKLTNPTTANIKLTAVGTATVLAANTPAVITNTSGTITLNPGTYLFWCIGSTTTSANQQSSVQLVKTAGTGTYTSKGISRAYASLYSVGNPTNTNSTGATAINIMNPPTVNAVGVKTHCYSEGTIIVSTSSVTFTLEGNSTTGAITFTVDVGSNLQLIKVA